MVNVTEQQVYEFLCKKYVQRADRRQKAMGLQYTEAETRDLAKELSVFINSLEVPIPTGVYYSLENDNFYRASDRKGMGTTFYRLWWRRRADFPRTGAMDPEQPSS